MDETGLSTVQNKLKKVLALKSKGQVGAINNGERGVTTTTVTLRKQIFISIVNYNTFFSKRQIHKMSIIPFDKWSKLFKIIRVNGGVFKSCYKLWRFETLKEGKYVGCDSNGNKYYMNNNYMICRSRWVEHNINYRWDYDASQVTSEWFGWLHYKTDKLPCEDRAKHQLLCNRYSQAWLLPPEENRTMTNQAYYPYSTTRYKIKIWDGKTVCTRNT